MVSNLRRHLQVLTLVTIALILLTTSAIITLLGFSTWHFLSTGSYHEIPLSFNHVRAQGDKPAALEAIADLTHAKLHSVATMEASTILSLPESQINLDNSVFQISSYLLSADDVCVAHSSSSATLTFRSPVHRAARAIVLFVPMLLGITREYQIVTKPLFRYEAIRRKKVPKLVTARVKIHTEALQIEYGELILRVGRTNLLTVMRRDGWLSTLTAITVGIWYCMLLSSALLFACVSATRRAIVGLVDTALVSVTGHSTGGRGLASGSERKGSLPRQILMGHGRLDDTEIGQRWATVYGFR